MELNVNLKNYKRRAASPIVTYIGSQLNKEEQKFLLQQAETTYNIDREWVILEHFTDIQLVSSLPGESIRLAKRVEEAGRLDIVNIEKLVKDNLTPGLKCNFDVNGIESIDV